MGSGFAMAGQYNALYLLGLGSVVWVGRCSTPRPGLVLAPCRGEVSERLKEHAWKVCVRQKRTEGSNPSLSAIFSSN